MTPLKPLLDGLIDSMALYLLIAIGGVGAGLFAFVARQTFIALQKWFG